MGKPLATRQLSSNGSTTANRFFGGSALRLGLDSATPMRFLRWGLCLAAVSWLAACGPGQESRLRQSVAAAASVHVIVDSRTSALTTFPCTQCHADLASDTRERKLARFHSRIELAHGTGSGWCYRCHAEGQLDHLRLPHGATVPFDEIEQLCGGCHGDEARDWRNDLHGRTIGAWNGVQHQAPCTECHDPHRPAFPSMTPLPPPSPSAARAALWRLP
jgi:hypothetical protein